MQHPNREDQIHRRQRPDRLRVRTGEITGGRWMVSPPEDTSSPFGRHIELVPAMSLDVQFLRNCDHDHTIGGGTAYVPDPFRSRCDAVHCARCGEMATHGGLFTVAADLRTII